MIQDDNTLVTILWKQWPAGWHIRHLSTDGSYTAELLSEYPPFRALVPGCLFHWDKVRVFALGEVILSLVDHANAVVQTTAHAGFFGVRTPTPNIYFYSPRENGPQAKCFLEMVSILDPYFTWLNLMIRSRTELFESNRD
jgi:hypothetical protein